MMPVRTFQSLRELARALPPPAQDRCELCAAALDERHEHLLGADTGALRCACPGCALAFTEGGPRFLRVVPLARRLPDDLLGDADWKALELPVGLAWLSVRRRDGELVACMPGTAGPTYAHPPASVWTALVAARPLLAEIVPDVQALLVRRLGGRREHWQVSVDECHRLAAFLRGGAARVDDFFASLREVAS